MAGENRLGRQQARARSREGLLPGGFSRPRTKAGTKGTVCKRGALVKRSSELGLQSRKGTADGTQWQTACLESPRPVGKVTPVIARGGGGSNQFFWHGEAAVFVLQIESQQRQKETHWKLLKAPPMYLRTSCKSRVGWTRHWTDPRSRFMDSLVLFKMYA
jgi:hypothetical protein